MSSTGVCPMNWVKNPPAPWKKSLMFGPLDITPNVADTNARKSPPTFHARRSGSWRVGVFGGPVPRGAHILFGLSRERSRRAASSPRPVLSPDGHAHCSPRRRGAPIEEGRDSRMVGNSATRTVARFSALGQDGSFMTRVHLFRSIGHNRTAQ